MLRNKYDLNMNVHRFISFCICFLVLLLGSYAKFALQKLQVSIIQLKPYNSYFARYNRVVMANGLKLYG